MSRKTLVFLVLIFLALLLLLNTSPRVAARIKVPIQRALSPFLIAGDAVFGRIFGFGNRFRSIDSLRSEKMRLQVEAERLRYRLNILKEEAEENKRLRKLLGFRDETSHTLIPARVIARDPSLWHESLIIDKGTNQGIAGGMAVVSSEGVVGIVLEAGKRSGKVLLLTDRNSRIGGLVQSTREAGVVEGLSGPLCRLAYLPGGSLVRSGARIVSSGLGGVFPKGLEVGMVVIVHEEKYGLYKYALVKPSVDFNKLEDVFVITRRRDTGRDDGKPAME